MNPRSEELYVRCTPCDIKHEKRYDQAMRSTWLFVALALAFAQGAAAVTDGDRTQVYREFRELFDARKYAEARPVAEQLVALTEEQYGADNTALVNPLSNLATTAYRLKDYPTAEKNYLRSVEILDAAGAAADRQLLVPLKGLGATYIALKQYEDAAIVLKRAVDLSRNIDGLFNIEQLPYLEPLIASYAALGNTVDAEKEQQYALRVAESAYGKSDVRMLGPLDRCAHWLEEVGRYTSARALHARALAIAEQNGGRTSPLTVPPLQGIARTYRLEFLHGSEGPIEIDDAFAGRGVGAEGSSKDRLNADGERALKQALAVVDRAQPVNHKSRGETLIELGDWYLSGGAGTKAIETYREAWKELAQADATKPLEAPRLIAYKGPVSSIKRSTLDLESAELHYVELNFTVMEDGRTSDITVASTDSPEALQKAVITSMKKARYSPRFENGEPVETQGVTMREQLLLRKPKPR